MSKRKRETDAAEKVSKPNDKDAGVEEKRAKAPDGGREMKVG